MLKAHSGAIYVYISREEKAILLNSYYLDMKSNDS